ICLGCSHTFNPQGLERFCCEPCRKAAESNRNAVIGHAEKVDHRIDLLPHEKGYDGAQMFYHGKKIGFASSGAIYAAARWLLDNGAAWPDDIVATYRGETQCMSGKAGELAKWRVTQNDHGNPSLQLVRWKPFPAPTSGSKFPKSGLEVPKSRYEPPFKPFSHRQ